MILVALNKNCRKRCGWNTSLTIAEGSDSASKSKSTWPTSINVVHCQQKVVKSQLIWCCCCCCCYATPAHHCHLPTPQLPCHQTGNTYHTALTIEFSREPRRMQPVTTFQPLLRDEKRRKKLETENWTCNHSSYNFFVIQSQQTLKKWELNQYNKYLINSLGERYRREREREDSTCHTGA